MEKTDTEYLVDFLGNLPMKNVSLSFFGDRKILADFIINDGGFSRRPELDELKIAETLWYHDRTDLFFPNIGKNEPFEKIKGTDLYDLYINRAKSICAKFSTPEAVELIEALKYCLWKLENTYELIHVNYACTPDGRPWHTKETYRETEEAKQFAKAIDQAKKVLSNHKDASCP